MANPVTPRTSPAGDAMLPSEKTRRIVLKGLSLSPYSGMGRVVIISSLKDYSALLEKTLVQDGDPIILVFTRSFSEVNIGLKLKEAPFLSRIKGILIERGTPLSAGHSLVFFANRLAACAVLIDVANLSSVVQEDQLVVVDGSKELAIVSSSIIC